MSETPRTDEVPSEESRIKRLREWAHRALLREPGASIIERTVAEDVQHLEAKYQRDLAAERERADRNQEDALTLMRALIKVRQQMFPQHDQRAVVSRDFPKLAAIDSARRK